MNDKVKLEKRIAGVRRSTNDSFGTCVPGDESEGVETCELFVGTSVGLKSLINGRKGDKSGSPRGL